MSTSFVVGAPGTRGSVASRATVPWSVVLGNHQTPGWRRCVLPMHLNQSCNSYSLPAPLVSCCAPCSSAHPCADVSTTSRPRLRMPSTGDAAQLISTLLPFLIPLLSLYYILTPPSAVALDCTLFSSPRSSTASKPCADPASFFD
jgi:hypothetical protein